MNKVLLKFSLAMIAVCAITGALSAVEGDNINKAGVEFGKKRQYNKAIGEFDKAISIYNRNSARLYHNKAWAYHLNGNITKAIKNYEEALKRNPKQTISGEKLGFIYYKTEDYENAVRIGEQVLKFDPNNRPVKKWLPDAYEKRLMARRAKELDDKKKQLERERLQELAKIKDEERKKEESVKLLVTFDFMIRTGYYFAGEDKGAYKYIEDKGAITNIPETLYIRFTPIPAWEFSAVLENPYLGALSPSDLCIHRERIEGVFRVGRFSLGLGVLFTHYKDDVSFGAQYSLFDWKVGLILGFGKDKYEVRISFYPRLLMYDGRANEGKTLDVTMFRLDYRYEVSDSMTIYSLFNFQEFFLFNHVDDWADYYGVYDFGLGVSLGRLLRSNNKMDFIFSVEFILRMYLQDLNNDNPYTRVPNGQGYFGLNTSKWLKGDAFSGYHAMSYVLAFRVDEEITSFLYLYQKFIVEIGDQSEDHHEFNFQLGLGVKI
jgi:tetratricopeptide (TPR) repeat protein